MVVDVPVAGGTTEGAAPGRGAEPGNAGAAGTTRVSRGGAVVTVGLSGGAAVRRGPRLPMVVPGK